MEISVDTILKDGKHKFLEFPRTKEIKTDEEGFYDLNEFQNTENLGGQFLVYKNKKKIGTLYQYKQKMYIVDPEDLTKKPIQVNYKELGGNDKKYDLCFCDEEQKNKIPVFVKEPKWEYVCFNGKRHTEEQVKAEKSGFVILRLEHELKTPQEHFIGSVNLEGCKEILSYHNGEIFNKIYTKDKNCIKTDLYDSKKQSIINTTIFKKTNHDLQSVYKALKEAEKDITTISVNNYIYANTEKKCIYY